MAASDLRRLRELRELLSAVHPDPPPVDLVVPLVRDLMRDAKAAYKFIGGIAVFHHGYERSTKDVDVLVAAEGHARVLAAAPAHGFLVESPRKLRHGATGVVVELLVEGEHMPRPDDPLFPAPNDLAASPRAGDIVGLAGLLELKLRARRHQDEADIVALLKPLDDAAYIGLAADVATDVRRQLDDLRTDALEELRFERDE
jgi:hypothetical protein